MGRTEVVNNLIDKLSSAVSWVFTRETPERLAVSAYLEEIDNSSLEPLTKAALKYKAKEAIIEYCNQRDVVQLAIEALSEQSKPENIDNDWALSFMNHVKSVSDDQLKALWAKLMVDESNETGSYSIRTLNCVKNLDKKEAQLFTQLATIAVFSNNRAFIIADDSVVSNDILSYEDILLLNDCGLIRTESMIIDFSLDPDEEDHIGCGDYIICGKNIGDKKVTVEFNSLILSEAGRQLLKLFEPTPNIEYLNRIKATLEQYSDIEVTTNW